MLLICMHVCMIADFFLLLQFYGDSCDVILNMFLLSSQFCFDFCMHALVGFLYSICLFMDFEKEVDVNECHFLSFHPLGL